MNVSRIARRRAVIAIIAALACAFTTLRMSPPMPAQAQAVRIFVNGTEMHFDQPPIERDNRVFVPLRGVFERLGATVVYENGQINATTSTRSVHLTIGSTNALVNGNTVVIDVAPFIVVGRTLVPLRFISQSLGATVDYNYSTHVVTVVGPGAGPARVQLQDLHPANGAVVAAVRPTISGRFNVAVNPNSVHITLDDRDVSATTEIWAHGFYFVPTYDLTPTSHTVHVTGDSTDGVRFDLSWSFTSGTSVVPNYLHNISPADGATVGRTFTESGTTLPGSTVHIGALATAVFGPIVMPASGYDTDVTADATGHFSASVTLASIASGGTVTVRITSTAPVTKAAAQVTVHYHT
jgi:hypothetical protein